MAILERFVVLLYSESCPATRTNQARKALFSKAKKALDPILPTQAALFEHSQKSVLQAFQYSYSYGGMCFNDNKQFHHTQTGTG